MKRITVNLDTKIGKQFEARAQEMKRTASAHAAKLIEDDLRAAGLIATEGSEGAAVIAAAEEIGFPKALAALKRSARRR